MVRRNRIISHKTLFIVTAERTQDRVVSAADFLPTITVKPFTAIAWQAGPRPAGKRSIPGCLCRARRDKHGLAINRRPLCANKSKYGSMPSG
jgi:hypothetical protein